MFALVIGLGGFGAVTAAPQVFVSPIAPPGPQALLSPLTVPQTVTSSEDPVKGWKLLYSPPVPDLFSGAASYAYPIEVPAGRNGLQPSVNLVYSSRAMDGLLDIGAIDPGPIALGWSLNFMDIVREGVHDWYDGAHYTQSFPDQFSLLIDATGLMFYQARYYSQAIGRFVSADTIVPDFSNPQSLNRFSYGYNNPLGFVDPSGHDPLDQEWIDAFRAVHHREPSTYDRLIRLFSIAFPDEWNNNGWQKFYNPDGTLRSDEMIHDVLINAPAGRDWSRVPDALAALAGYYTPDESEKYVRDIGSLFGGLPDRVDEPSIEKATTEPPLPRHHWAYLGRSGIPASFSNDVDGNVHHWAWALTLGVLSKTMGDRFEHGA